jgi:hypothetical protein
MRDEWMFKALDMGKSGEKMKGEKREFIDPP